MGSNTGEPITPPLRLDGGASAAEFSPDGRQMPALGNDNLVRIGDMPRDDRPMEDLILLTQLLAGRRIDSAGGVVPVEPNFYRSAWNALKTKYPDDFMASAARVLTPREWQAFAIRLRAQPLFDIGYNHAQIGNWKAATHQKLGHAPEAKAWLAKAVQLEMPAKSGGVPAMESGSPECRCMSYAERPSRSSAKLENNEGRSGKPS